MNKNVINKVIKEENYVYVAVFFLLLQSFLIYANWDVERYYMYFWYCNHILIFFAIALLFKKKQAVKALVAAGLIGQLGWSIDFLSFFILGDHIMGSTAYVFEIQQRPVFIATILVHLFSSFVALLFTIDVKPKMRTLLYASLYWTGLYLVLLLFTTPIGNPNCVYALCGFEDVHIPFYKFLWPFLAFFLVTLPGYYLQFYLYKWYVKNDKDL